jgi:hypothetical protein
VIAGLGAEPIAVQPPTVFVRRELQVLGSYRFTATLQRVLSLVEAGALDLQDSITPHVPARRGRPGTGDPAQELDDRQRVVVIPQ